MYYSYIANSSKLESQICIIIIMLEFSIIFEFLTPFNEIIVKNSF